MTIYPPPHLESYIVEGLRKAGYAFFRDPNSGEESFVCRLGPDFYPRFHLYVEKQKEGSVISLHLDQKQTSYGTGHLHNGEYEGEHIEQEFRRITGWIEYVASIATNRQ